MSKIKQTTKGETTWNTLYRLGGIAPLITLACYLTQLAAILLGGEYPVDAAGWTALFQRSRILGLLYINALDTLSIAILGVLFIALYAALRRASESLTAVAGFFALLGVPVFIIPRVLMLSLLPFVLQSGAVAAGARPAAVETAMAIMNSIGIATPQTAGFFFLAVSGTILSVVMLRSGIFGKAVAWLGILAGILTLAGGIWAVLGLPAAAALGMIHGMLWLAWWLLAGRGLLLLGR